MVLFVALAAISEIVEFFAGFEATKKFGASNWGAFGAVGGGIIGAILGGLIPILIIGPIIGVLVGTIAGAFIVELIRQRSMNKGAKAGFGALIGRAIAVSFKVLIGIVMCVLVIGLRWF
jgi:uncharacterized protein YqgC (DUF456 family)